MRSPWKLIAGLVTRGRSNGTEESAEADPTVFEQIDEVSDLANAAKLPEQAEVQQQPAPLPEPPEPPLLRSQTDPSAAKGRRTAQKGVPSDTKPIRPSVAQPSIAVVKPPQPPSVQASSSISLPGADALLGTMELDKEINQLRYLLSEKLRLQNEELKRLLSRYDQH